MHRNDVRPRHEERHVGYGNVDYIRVQAAHDYEINLKAELEIRRLHEKLDELRERQWSELLEIQKRQIQILERLLAEKAVSPD